MVKKLHYKLQTANLKLKKALSSWDSAFFLLIAGKVDLFQGNEVSLMFEFVIEEDGQEDGDADVGDTGTVPVYFRSGKGRIILACCDDDAHQ